MRILVDQSRRPHDGADKYRLILRLAWATAGLYMPRDKSNLSRVLACEVLPRCLSVRVARRNVTLPDPIFHGGQAQKFGHRLRFAIDITDKIVTRSNFLVRGRGVEIDLTWLHAPLEDHALPLLEMVGSGSCTPILNHLLNLPLIQVTLDRVQPIPEFVRMFSSAVAGEPVTDPPAGCKFPRLPSETPEALVGVYDFCMSSDRVIAASETLVSSRPQWFMVCKFDVYYRNISTKCLHAAQPLPPSPAADADAAVVNAAGTSSTPQASPPNKAIGLFVDLAASLDEEPDVTMASTPPLSSPEPSAAPTPSSISPTTTESCSLPAVIPSPSLTPTPSVLPRPLNLVGNSTQPVPPLSAADAAVASAAGTSSTPQESLPPNKSNKATG
nr:unnamed protein product [Spirometra erinaceieuropaei]